jgi:hypothetical protein
MTHSKENLRDIRDPRASAQASADSQAASRMQVICTSAVQLVPRPSYSCSAGTKMDRHWCHVLYPTLLNKRSQMEFVREHCIRKSTGSDTIDRWLCGPRSLTSTCGCCSRCYSLILYCHQDDTFYHFAFVEKASTQI